MKLLTKKEVGRILGIHPDSVMRLARRGEFPAPIRLGSGVSSVVRFDANDVSDWAARRKADFTAGADVVDPMTAARAETGATSAA